MARFRNPRYAPESLERRLSPSDLAPTPPPYVYTAPTPPPPPPPVMPPIILLPPPLDPVKPG